MTDEHTFRTSLDSVRAGYSLANGGHYVENRAAAFDRWLDEHDAEVKADAWDEGAAANWDGQDMKYPNPYRKGE